MKFSTLVIEILIIKYCNYILIYRSVIKNKCYLVIGNKAINHAQPIVCLIMIDKSNIDNQFYKTFR